MALKTDEILLKTFPLNDQNHTDLRKQKYEFSTNQWCVELAENDFTSFYDNKSQWSFIKLYTKLCCTWLQEEHQKEIKLGIDKADSA